MTAQRPTDPPHTVLVAASSAFDHVALGQMLGRHGYHVRAVGRGDEALAAAGAGGIAVAVLDAAVTGSASMELCQRLRKLCGAALPIYVLSSHPSPDERERALLAGATSYLPLSYQADDLAEKILLKLNAIAPASMVW